MKYLLLIFLTTFLISEEAEPLWTTIFPDWETNESVEMSPDGNFILVDGDINVHILRSSDGEIIHTIEDGHKTKYSEDGSFFYYVKNEKIWKVDTETFEQTELMEIPQSYGDFCYSHDLDYLVHGLGFENINGQNKSKGLNIYNLETGELYKHIEHIVPCSSIPSLSSDNKYLSWIYHYQDLSENINFISVLYDTEKDSVIELLDYGKRYRFHPNNNTAIVSESNGWTAPKKVDTKLT